VLRIRANVAAFGPPVKDAIPDLLANFPKGPKPAALSTFTYAK
jgi:hypothetical protein